MVSPHLDDAVLGCGKLLCARPGVRVVTLFAGRPAGGHPLTSWDAASGFAPGEDVVGARRREDARALGVLAAEPIWLDFLDAQYGDDASDAEVAAALAAEIAALRPSAVLMPLGLFHSDHERAREIALRARGDGAAPGQRWLAYADGVYAELPGAVRAALRGLRARGLVLRSARLELGALAWKKRALACYASQLRAFAARGALPGDAALGRERYWRIA